MILFHKKIPTILCLFLAFSLLFFSCSEPENETPSNDRNSSTRWVDDIFKYDLDYDDATDTPVHTASVAGFSANYDNRTEIEIKDKVTKDGVNYSVTKIELGSFDGKKLTSVKIPDSVTTIGYGAFADNELTSVTIPKNVRRIGAIAFRNNPITEVCSYPLVAPIISSSSFPDTVENVHIKPLAQGYDRSYTSDTSVTKEGNWASVAGRTPTADLTTSTCSP